VTSEPTSEFKVAPHTVYLRAVAGTITGAGLLYTAASMLLSPSDDAALIHNAAVVDLTTRLLELPTTNPDAVETALRNLPERPPS